MLGSSTLRTVTASPQGGFIMRRLLAARLRPAPRGRPRRSSRRPARRPRTTPSSTRCSRTCDNWDPPNSVLREAIILGYHVFDHLAARDLKTRKVGPNLAISWKALDDTTWEVKLRQGVKFHDGTPVHRQGRQGHLRPRAGPDEEDDRARQPRQDQERRGRGRPHRPLQDRRALPALRRAAHRAGDAVREGDQEKGHEWMQEQPDRHRALQAREVETGSRSTCWCATTTTGGPSPPSSTSASASSPSRPPRSPS